MKLSKEGIDELPKYGFDRITLYVIFQGQKCQNRSNLGILLLFGNFIIKGTIFFVY